MSETNKTNTLALNIPADGLFLEIIRKAGEDYSKENCFRIMREYIKKQLDAGVDIVFLNVCYRRSLIPSEVFDSYMYNIETDENGFAVRDKNGETIKTLSPVVDPETKYFRAFTTCARRLYQDGIDVYEFLVDEIKKSNAKVYFSLRMNDGHCTSNPSINSSFAMKNNGANTIDKNGVELDFSLKVVQNYFTEYIKELLNKYDIDGIELDWIRHPKILPESKRSDFSIMTNYMKNIRKLLDGKDKKLGLSVRVLPNEKDNLTNGVDVSGWVADGCVNLVAIENFYIPTNFEMPVSSWRESISKRNVNNNPYLLLCGSDWAVSCVPYYNFTMSPALVRGFANECLNKGADGVYLFNFFEDGADSSYELAFDENNNAYLKNCFFERIKAGKEPNLLPRRLVHCDDLFGRYPITIKGGLGYTFNSRITSPYNKCEVVVGVDKNANLILNVDGNENAKFTNKEVYKGFEYIKEVNINRNGFVHSLSQIAPFVMGATITGVSDGIVSLNIKNDSQEDVNVLWIEVSFS